MDDDSDFLDDIASTEEVANVTRPVVDEPVVAEVIEPEVQEPVVEAKPEPQHVPLTAMLDERDKRKALEQELERLRAAQQPQAQPNAPDMFEDPEAYTAYQNQIVQQARINDKLDISEEMARDKFGDEKVEAAKAWALQMFQTRPGFQQEVLGQRHPYKYAVEQYEREQIASQVTPDDYAQFQAWKAAQSQIREEPKAATTPPPRSLASAPSAGGINTEVAPTEDEIFADAIPLRK